MVKFFVLIFIVSGSFGYKMTVIEWNLEDLHDRVDQLMDAHAIKKSTNYQ